MGPLAGASALEHLDVSHNPVTQSLDDFATHQKLLSLLATDIDLTTLPTFAPTSLRTLTLADNAIVDLQPLAAYEQLDHLDLQGNAVTTLAPLVGAPWLENCDFINLVNNPLDAESLGEIAPALCEAKIQVVATGFEDCVPCLSD